jgi:outer membrane lipoprotein SlyB
MRILAGPPEHGRSLAGEVVATMVIGPAVQCVVRADDGQELIVRQQRVDGEGDVHLPREGERVFVAWTEGAALDLDGTDKEVRHG